MDDLQETQNNTTTEISLDAKIESILFYKGEPIKIKDLAKIFDVDKTEIEKSLEILQEKLSGRGLYLILNQDEVLLATSPETSEIIKSIRKEEMTKDLSKAALETLSIIMYRGPLKRSEIDYIRGVNSQFIIRLLLVRGLIEKSTDPKDERAYVYRASFDLLAHLGLSKVEDIPEYENVNAEIDNFIAQESESNDDGQKE